MASSPVFAASEIGARTIRKVRQRILPYIFLLYIIAYLDRINVSTAALTMNKELAITSQQFGLLFGIFFFGYFLFEIPSNLMLHKIGPRIWIARILISWGIVSMLNCFAQNVIHVYVLRFLLGVAEAGFFPGIILYLTYWFRQREQAQAVALFMTALAVAPIVGLPLSGLILDRASWFGISSWRWLFVLEALPAILFGVLTYYVLPSRPAEAKFLTQEERDWITQELEREEQNKARTHKISAMSALADLQVWHLTFIYFLLAVVFYATNAWMPQIVKSLFIGWSNTAVGVVGTVPYAAGLIAMVLVSTHSDRTMERRYHAAIPVMAGGIALLALGAPHSTLVSLVLLSAAVMGIYGVYGPFWSVPNQFLSGYSAACGIAVINSFGNLGGFVGPYVVGVISKKNSLQGGLALVGVSLFLAAVLLLLLPSEKQMRAKDCFVRSHS